MDTPNLLQADPLSLQHDAPATRKTIEYLYVTTALGLRVAPADLNYFDPSLRWCLLEYRIDDDDIGRELSRYVSLSAPKAIVEARRALADAKAAHVGDIATLELDLDDAEQRWTHACRQKLQALRVKLTEMCAHAAPDAHELALPGDDVAGDSVAHDTAALLATDAVANRRASAPHYFIYRAPGPEAAPARADPANVSQLRARNYIGGWLLEADVEVAASKVALCGWPLPAFRRWIQGVSALRRKPPRDEGAPTMADCVLAAGRGACLVMDLAAFAACHLPRGK
jgi:hypothetical protein